MSKTVLLMLLIALTLSAILNVAKPRTLSEEEQADFNGKFGKKYEKSNNDIKNYRKTVYQQNAAEVKAHNGNKSRSYEKGTNLFSDLTREEFAASYLGLIAPSGQVETSNLPKASQNNLMAGLTFNPVDWKGIITPVKFQGSCNSCWAFSALAAIQAAYQRKNPTNNYDLSEQQLLECLSSSGLGTSSCQGGRFQDALKYVSIRRINTESRYPYTAVNGAGFPGSVNPCKNIPGNIRISSYQVVNKTTPFINMSNILVNRGPIAVAVDATYWNDYKSGLFNFCFTLSATSVNHGVLLVSANNAEWRVKNSWGTSWGERGYMRLLGPNTTYSPPNCCCNICQYYASVVI